MAGATSVLTALGARPRVAQSRTRVMEVLVAAHDATAWANITNKQQRVTGLKEWVKEWVTEFGLCGRPCNEQYGAKTFTE